MEKVVIKMEDIRREYRMGDNVVKALDGFSLEIKEGEYIGLFDKQIETHGSELKEQALQLAKKMIDEDSSIITLFYGEDVSKEDAEQLGEEIQELADLCDVEVVYGGQPIYYYIISVE